MLRHVDVKVKSSLAGLRPDIGLTKRRHYLIPTQNGPRAHGPCHCPPHQHELAVGSTLSLALAEQEHCQIIPSRKFADLGG